MDKLRYEIVKLERENKNLEVKIANASKRREAGLDDLIAKKAKIETSIAKLIKKAEYTTDYQETPDKVDYDANPNTETQDAPAEDTGDTLAIPDENSGETDVAENMDSESDIGGDIGESSGSVSDAIMDSIADVIEEKASEGLSVDDLVAALRGDDAGAEDFTPEDDALDLGEDDSDFTDDEDLDFSEGEDDFGEDEIIEDGSAPSESLPENEQFKFASLKCKKCGGTNFIKQNNKFACSNCKALISEMLGLPMDVLELISPKLREESQMSEEISEDAPFESNGIEEVDENGLGDIEEIDEPDITVVGMEEPIEEIGENEFGEDEFEDGSETHEDLESPIEEEIEHESGDSEFGESEETHEEAESPEEEEAEHTFDGSESDGKEDADESEDGSEEHESDESPEEEEAEHESDGSKFDKDDEDQNLKEAEVIYKARLKKKADKSQTYWLVFGNEVPLFKLSARYAWEDINAVPAKDEFPVKFASYYDAFTSVLYRDTIVEHCKTSGFKSCCERANGRLLKSAQTFSGINNPLQQNGGSENPTPNTNTMNAPGMPDSGTLNPDAESEQMFNEDDPNKLLITDMIINYLAPEIANDSYNLDEIMTELKATFSDEAAMSEFEGQLRESADSFGDKKEAEPLGEENPETGMNPLAAPMATAGQSEGAANATEPIQPIKAASKVCKKCKKSICTCKEDELAAKLAASELELENQRVKSAAQAAKDSMRFRVFQAKNYVEKEMQTRGNLGEPIVPTVEYLISLGKSASVAEEEVKLAIKESIKKIVDMSDTEFANYSELVEKTPKLASREDEENKVKFASIMENESTTPLPYMTNNELKSGMDAIFGDDMFGGSKLLTALADQRAKERQQNRRC
jgi:hypothetical protein